MSNTIQPITQLPTPCDFGPFAGGYCGKVITLNFNQAESDIKTADITIELLETATMTLDLNTLVTTIMPIDWTKTIFGDIPTGVKTFDQVTGILTYKPDETPTTNRTITFSYTLTDSLGATSTSNITINVVDKTPILFAASFSLSGPESQIFNIDIPSHVTATNTTVNYADPAKVSITLAPSEGTATINNGVITYTPILTPAITRTIPIKYRVTDLTGLSSEGTISITLSDVTPTLSTTNIAKTVMDNVDLTGSILSAITIKNDTFKLLAFGLSSEGYITVNGSNYTYHPDVNVTTASRTVTIPYTVTTTSGLMSTSNLVITVNEFNKWATTFWYGNSSVDVITQAAIEALTATTKTSYAGTYAFTAGSGVYKWIIYPKAWGITPTILDSNTLMEIATDDYKYITVNGIDLIAIRTYYQVNGAISMKMS